MKQLELFPDTTSKKETQMNKELLSFEAALGLLKVGCRVSRQGWNGKGMYVYLVDGSKFTVNRPPLNKMLPEGTECTYRPHIDMRTADGSFVPWVASQTDLLAHDWFFVDKDEF